MNKIIWTSETLYADHLTSELIDKEIAKSKLYKIIDTETITEYKQFNSFTHGKKITFNKCKKQDYQGTIEFPID